MHNLTKEYNKNEIPSFEENCFDVLRLLAGIIVLLSHSFRHFGIAKPPFLLYLTDGSTGVIILFALSGYLTYASYDRIVKNGGSVWLFLYRRLTRILPLYLLSVSVLVIADMFNGTAWNLEYIIRRIAYIITFAWVSVPVGVSNGVLWSLHVEVVFYFLIPVFYRLLNDKKINWWIVTILILWQFNLWDRAFLDLLKKLPVIYRFSRISNSLCFIYEFLIGSMVYCCRNQVLPWLSQKKNAIVLLAGFSIWFILYEYCRIIPPFGQMHNAIFGITIPFVAMSIGYAFGKHRLNFDISYAMYLFHMYVITFFIKCTEGGIFWMIMAWVTTIILSFALHYCFEKPVSRMLKKWNTFL